MKLTTLCHQTLTKHIQPNWTIVDATLGNGHDALFLLEQLKGTGKLFGFDIQDEAINSTDQKLKESGYDNYQLFRTCHSNLKTTLAQNNINQINLITYNFGYLPGGDPEITTEAKTSLESIQQAVELLALDGVISMMLYPGHPQGKIEAAAIEDYLKSNEQLSWTKTKAESDNKDAPFYLLINSTS